MFKIKKLIQNMDKVFIIFKIVKLSMITLETVS